MLRAYKFRLYPNAEQRLSLARHFGCVRWVWNWALAKKMEVYQRGGKSLHRFELQAELPSLKQAEETKWLSDVNAQSLQAVLRNLDTAYTNFFRKIKQGDNKAFPNFKSKHDRQSFECPQRCEVDFKNRSISVPKIVGIKYRDDRTFAGEIRQITISKTLTHKYYASILVEDGIREPTPRKRINASQTIGVDMGLKHFCTLSTGEKIENPRWLKKSLRKLRRHQRALSRSKKGSARKERKHQRVARLHERIANQRRDFQHKLSTMLIRENQAVALETLDVQSMQKNRRLARSLNDVGWSAFMTMLEYKARWQGKSVLKIGRYEPSSKLCTCGKMNNELSMADRTWTCGHCGTTHDRDILAANNIKRMALHPQNFLAAGSREFTPVESCEERTRRNGNGLLHK